MKVLSLPQPHQPKAFALTSKVMAYQSAS